MLHLLVTLQLQLGGFLLSLLNLGLGLLHLVLYLHHLHLHLLHLGHRLLTLEQLLFDPGDIGLEQAELVNGLSLQVDLGHQAQVDLDQPVEGHHHVPLLVVVVGDQGVGHSVGGLPGLLVDQPEALLHLEVDGLLALPGLLAGLDGGVD